MQKKILTLLVLLMTAVTGAWAGSITVYFTDAQNYGDVNVYYWPNGGDWPGSPMTPVRDNEFGQKIYKAVVPADVEGIIFNGNGRQTVNITENIADEAWWYANEATDDQGHNTVGYVGTYFIGLTSTDGSNWTFQMPACDVELEVEYFPLATLATLPAAAEGVVEGTDAALLTLGTSAEGTLAYAIGTSEAPTGQWSDAIPTAQDLEAGTCYVWYKVVGDAEHSDSQPQSIAVTIAALPAFAVTIDDAGVDASNWQAPTEPQKTGQTVTLSYSGKKKIRSITIEAAPVPVESITLNKTETEITAGEKETLSVTEVLPDNAKDKSVTWSSGNMSVATVNAETGEVTAKAAGTAYITATANDGSGVQSSCKVTVRNPTLADVFTDGAVVCVAVKNEYDTYTVTGTYSGGSYTNLSESAKYHLFNFSMTKDGNNLVVWMERTPSSKCTITFNTQDNTYALTLEEDGEPDELSLSELVSITVKGVDITSTLAEVILTTVTWDSSNSINLGAYSSEPYTNEGITLSINGDRNVANWLYYNGEGIYFWLYESGDFTFTAPSGKKFTKIEMTVNAADKWSDAAENNKLGSGWPSGMESAMEINQTNKVTWTGTTASTVSLLAGASDFKEVPPVTSIVFTLMHPKLISLTVDDPNDTVGGAKSIYYFKGETWSQAIANHPTENDGWSSTEIGVDYHGSQVWDESKSAPVSPSETIKTDGSYYFN